MSPLFISILDIKLELSSPLSQFVRYKQSFTRKPRPIHFPGQLIATVVKPKLPPRFDKHFPLHLKCRKPLVAAAHKIKQDNPYETILANEIKDVVMKSKMLLIIHRNPSTNHLLHRATLAFKRENMTFMRNSRTTFELALSDTKYSPILDLFRFHTLLLAGPKPDVYTAYNLLEKMPYFVVLAGVIEDKFVDRQTLDEFGKIPDLNAARAQLAHTLNTPAMMLAHNITLYGDSLEFMTGGIGEPTPTPTFEFRHFGRLASSDTSSSLLQFVVVL
ncbi:hypothetical protein V9T40_009427 [Parthenolecanium corni]|uniref:Large ribosomal subunit protein uL10m n=1 Tax=Parthenolecanium corni TaxID=536013 RepID=A0AAN9Y7H7_9HEMI